MKTLLQITVLALALMILETASFDSSTKSLTVFPSAQARVGRPLTPVSVAGVARRTVRRCAAGVYYCLNNKIVPEKTTAQKS
ncbi:MAG: hypothetical protein HC883_04810 [Bdellovibrionaceae bacterium]|nr:hypothetical protein [Pseudobdellovibrionaceae bacterium]